MTVESVTYITDLNATNPAGTDPKSEGDDHIRNIKTGLDGTFPNFAGIAMTSTEAELNLLDGVTATTAELNILDGATTTATELNYVDGVTSSIQTQFDNIISSGLMSGLILSNDTDADHDINVTAGSATGDTDALLTLSAEMTKQIDASWVAGDDAGGLSSSLTVANNTWYNVFLVIIAGSTDIIFDTSLTCANGIADHTVTAYKWIGAVKTNGAANIIAFIHNANTPDYFEWDVVAPDLTTTNPGTDLLTTLSVPTGFKAIAHISHTVENTNTGTQMQAAVRDPDMTNGALTVYEYDHHRIIDLSGYARGSSNRIRTMTNSSSQIRTRSSFSNSLVSLHIGTVGWEVDRKTV